MYVKQQLHRVYEVIQDIPTGLGSRSRRGWGANLLSRITGLATEDELDSLGKIFQNLEGGIQECGAMEQTT